MKKSSEAGSPNPRSDVLRISPLGKLDERKLKVGGEAFKRGKNADSFDIGTLVWNKVQEFGNEASTASDDPYLRAFPKAAETFADSSENLPTAEDLVVAYFSFNAACRAFEPKFPGWKISLSTGLLHESNAFDANEIDLMDVFALETKTDSDPFFQSVFAEMREIPDFKDYSTVVFDFFWPAGLFQILPIARKMRELGKKTVLNFTRANEQSDFTQWIETFGTNPEIFERLDAIVVYEDYGYALNAVLDSFRNGNGVPEGLGNIAYFKDGETHFHKPSNPTPEELFQRFETYFHSAAKERRIAGRKISTVRLFPYKCYWSSCFFCTINSTHLYSYEHENSDYIDSCLDYVEKNGIGYLYLADEATHPKDILEFAQKVIDRKLDLVYRFRARFDLAYDDEACELLYRSGARYVGVGLECASDRVSELINKGNELSLVQKTRIIDSFEKAGIPFHNYAILGLPGERQDEMYETYLFLSRNIRERGNYTCSPNVFGLNKGSVYEKHGEKFGVEIIEKPVSKTALQLRIEMARTGLFSESQRQFALELHRLQFLDFCSKDLVKGAVPRDFWDFVDRTGMFYHLKSFFPESPYRKPVTEARKVLESDFAALLAGKFDWTPYATVSGTAESPVLTNLATGFSVGTPCHSSSSALAGTPGFFKRRTSETPSDGTPGFPNFSEATSLRFDS